MKSEGMEVSAHGGKMKCLAGTPGKLVFKGMLCSSGKISSCVWYNAQGINSQTCTMILLLPLPINSWKLRFVIWKKEGILGR